MKLFVADSKTRCAPAGLHKDAYKIKLVGAIYVIHILYSKLHTGTHADLETSSIFVHVYSYM